MTTIAANRSSMAGDTRVSDDGADYDATKIFIVNDSIVGVAGKTSATNKFLAWFRAGRTQDGPSFDDDDGFRALVLNRSGLFLYCECGEPDQLHNKQHAIGSGGGAALALMRLCGWSPREAVIGASKVDNSTGGKVTVLRVADIPRVRKG